MEQANPNPPSYPASIPTIHDEIHRAIRYREPCIASLGSVPHLLGYLEHHLPSSDGSFAICIAGGTGVFIKQELYESIPAEHRPALDTTDAGTKIALSLFGGHIEAIGTTFLPFLLTDDTNQKVRLVLHTYVVPELVVGMFMGMRHQGFKLQSIFRGGEPPEFTFISGENAYRFIGIPYRLM